MRALRTLVASSDPRQSLLVEWLGTRIQDRSFALTPASSDASFRRYFRIAYGDGRTAIAMDAPPPQEDCRPFVAIARLLRDARVNAPEVLDADIDRGFLLLSDLGSRTYLAALDDDSASSLYGDANAALVRMQASVPSTAVPPYDRALLTRELELFPEWYAARHKARPLSPALLEAWRAGCETLLGNNLAQPVVFVHRDYHSRNLMVCDDNPGVLDFQDGVGGPITYDLVSLYKDAYVSWDEEFVLDQVARYWSAAKRAGLPVDRDFAAFYRDFEWMGVQRQLKVLGIFARLWHRDGKPAYLDDMPRVRRGLLAALGRYRELAPLARVVDAVEDTAVVAGYTS